MVVPDINTSLVQVDFEVFGQVQGKKLMFTFFAQNFLISFSISINDSSSFGMI